ncbi:elongation factor P [Candidatus Gottesmanbacteria bacterium RIFCSPLOWO2_01_FULL_39_12b]|uniref:Elongation factor P n=1 Tax=Candidatus Gottesmanbacteria bacterium RIFCSPLOWO2_01_FULL_39_12b TaxID=1798388 RepID=A0A1F6AQW6_9BACT|nr:MAG: elongation factor P [Candidatus Gottesmanbacteria bacterium RIFCSPLOWO2_01_FULL_39_12b]
MTRITTSNFQKGIFIEYKNEPHQIVEFQFVNPGKGSAFVRTKLRNVKTGRVYEFTYKSGESVVEVFVNVSEMQYLYNENGKFVFMDQKNYNQISLSEEVTGSFHQYLKEGEIYQIFIQDQEAIGMRYPKKVRLMVSEAEEGVKGNTVTGAKKTVILETGARVTVPLFIKKGDFVSIDAETGEYVERISG